MAQEFGVSETRKLDLPVLAVRGDVDIATKDALQSSLDAMVEAPDRVLVVDLSEVTFIDSTGLGVLVTTLTRCREAGKDLHLVTESPRVLQLLSITGLDETFSVVGSLEEIAGT